MNTDTTDTVHLALVVGSVRRERIGPVLAGWAEHELRRVPWVDLDVVDLSDEDLPMEAVRPGGSRSPVSDRLDRADGFLIITPEYNHSFPAALKNAIDWHYGEWAYKPVAFIGYGAGSGGARAIEQLRQVFPEVRATTTRDAVLLNNPWERIDSGGRYLPGDGEVPALLTTVDELGWWARILRIGREQRWGAA